MFPVVVGSKDSQLIVNSGASFVAINLPGCRYEQRIPYVTPRTVSEIVAEAGNCDAVDVSIRDPEFGLL